jgi:exo-1,4-beta-D-glucosaminidase
MRLSLVGLVSACCLALAAAPPVSAHEGRLALTRGWAIQSSAKVPEKGDVLSRPGFRAEAWEPARVPNTVVAVQVENGRFPDPYFAMNLRSIPGTSYPIGQRFTLLPMPEDSPYHSSWWYRSEFEVPAALRGRSLALHFDGINYRADVWLNGRRLARSTEVAGTYRLYEFDVTDVVRRDGPNSLAIEVWPPEPDDLAWTWVDWNPAPPDKNMGLWRGVSVTTSGDVTIRSPHVVSHVEPSPTRADCRCGSSPRSSSAASGSTW